MHEHNHAQGHHDKNHSGNVDMPGRKSFIPAFHYHFLTPTYEAMARPFASRIWKRMASEVVTHAPKGGTVVDLGCGPGTVLRLIRERRPDLKLTGVDVDPAIVDIAEREAAKKNIHFHVTSIDRLPFVKGSADIVISSLVFHHLDEPVKRIAFWEIRRILKPDGYFLLCDFSLPRHRWLIPLAIPILFWEHEAIEQLRGQLLRLASEAGATVELLALFYGCIGLHKCMFPD